MAMNESAQTDVRARFDKRWQQVRRNTKRLTKSKRQILGEKHCIYRLPAFALSRPNLTLDLDLGTYYDTVISQRLFMKRIIYIYISRFICPVKCPQRIPKFGNLLCRCTTVAQVLLSLVTFLLLNKYINKYIYI